MNVTANELIEDGYLYAKVGDQYNPIDGPSVQVALRALNDMVDEFCADAQTVFDIVEYTTPAVAGSNNMLLGPSNVTITPAMAQAPMIVELFSPYDANGISYPATMIGPREWGGIAYKAANGRPRYAWLEYSFPDATLWTWPTESFSTDVFHIWAGLPIPQFAALTNVFAAPPAYTMFFKTELALRLCELNNTDPGRSLLRLAKLARQKAVAPHKPIHLLNTNLPYGVAERWRYNIYGDFWN